jgi:manganese/iron transport system permease protein
MLLIALTIVASMKAVGVILVLALLITPGATAYLLVKRLHQVMILGAGIGIFSSISGMYLSYFYNLPSGPAIVLVASGFFILALLFSPSYGIFTQKDLKLGQSSLWRELKQLFR